MISVERGLVLSLSVAFLGIANAQTLSASTSTIQYASLPPESSSGLEHAHQMGAPQGDAPEYVADPSGAQVKELIAQGEVELGRGQFDEVENDCRIALSRVDPVRDPIPRGEVLTLLGFVQLRKGDWSAAEQSFATAQPFFNEHTAGTLTPNVLRVGLAATARVRGQTQRVQTLLQQLQQDFPPQIRPPDGDHLRAVARMTAYLRMAGFERDAVPYMRAIVTLQDQNPQIEPNTAAFMSLQLASMLGGLHADEKMNVGPDGKPTDQPSEIERYADHAVELLDRHGGATGPLAETALELMGREQVIRRAWVPATHTLQRALKLGHQRVPWTKEVSQEASELAEAFAGQARWPEAINALAEAVAVDRTLLPASQAELTEHLEREGQFQCAEQQCVAGLGNLRAARAVNLGPPDHRVLSGFRLAEMLQISGTLAEARSVNQEALAEYPKMQPNVESAANLHQQRGEILLAQRELAPAIEEFSIAQSLYSQVVPTPEHNIVEMQAYRAAARYQQGDHQVAAAAAMNQISAFGHHNDWPPCKGLAAAERVVGLEALALKQTYWGIQYLNMAWKVRSSAVPGGQATIAQGWELAQVLRQTKSADHPRSADVIELLYGMLKDSPGVQAPLRAHITQRWEEIRRNQKQVALIGSKSSLPALSVAQ